MRYEAVMSFMKFTAGFMVIVALSISAILVVGKLKDSHTVQATPVGTETHSVSGGAKQ